MEYELIQIIHGNDNSSSLTAIDAYDRAHFIPKIIEMNNPYQNLWIQMTSSLYIHVSYSV